jgi:2-dehydro-3-deoxyphosphogluconate aldolase / (4S)-4-hydroxy-2-oxoglutarate aldolase
VTNQASRPAIPAGLVAGGVVAIARRLDPEAAVDVVIALADGGVRAFEITLNDPVAKALRAIEAVAGPASARGLSIGAGTVLSIAAARQAVEAGATFLVMPHVDTELVAWASEHGIPVLPGAATPTEVLAAWTAGAAAVKLFPASSLGPSFIRELAGPFPDIPVVPTGGVTAETAGSFIAAGAVAVGLGSWLVGDGVAAGVEARARQVVAAVAAARQGRPT